MSVLFLKVCNILCWVVALNVAKGQNLTSAPTTNPTLTPSVNPTAVLSRPMGVTWESAGQGGCTGGLWIYIGTANNLDEAQDLMLAHELCSQDLSMLFYSVFSYDISWGVRCAVAENHGTCVDSNPNWQRYILHTAHVNSAPTANPTLSPTTNPTLTPSVNPTLAPTLNPTAVLSTSGWDCHLYTTDELNAIYSGTPEASVCESVADRVFTVGDNTNYPGCGNCFCCTPQNSAGCGVSTCRATDWFETCGAGKICGAGGCYDCPEGSHACPRDKPHYFKVCPDDKQCHSTGCVTSSVTGIDQQTYMADKSMCCAQTTTTTPASATTTTTASEVCERPASGCEAGHDIYWRGDCDGDGIDDHACSTNINDYRWLVLSTEECPNHWGNSDRQHADCPGAFGSVHDWTIVELSGSSPAYAAGSEYDKAWDGDVSTFFDLQQSHDGYTQARFSCAVNITALEYWPRYGYTSRMPGGRFVCIDSDGIETIVGTIIGEPDAEQWTSLGTFDAKVCSELKYASPDYSHGNIAEIRVTGRCNTHYLAYVDLGAGVCTDDAGNRPEHCWGDIGGDQEMCEDLCTADSTCLAYEHGQDWNNGILCQLVYINAPQTCPDGLQIGTGAEGGTEVTQTKDDWTNANCYLKTLSVTSAPTTNPTLTPSVNPTLAPTLNPTAALSIVIEQLEVSSCSASSEWSPSYACEFAYVDVNAQWATAFEGIGSWIQYSFADQVTITSMQFQNRVCLSGIIQTDDCGDSMRASLEFSNNQFQEVYFQDRSGLNEITLEPVQTTFVKMTIIDVYSTVDNGAQILQFFGYIGEDCNSRATFIDNTGTKFDDVLGYQVGWGDQAVYVFGTSDADPNHWKMAATDVSGNYLSSRYQDIQFCDQNDFGALQDCWTNGNEVTGEWGTYGLENVIINPCGTEDPSSAPTFTPSTLPLLEPTAMATENPTSSPSAFPTYNLNTYLYDASLDLESSYEIFEGRCVNAKGRDLKGYSGCMSLSQCTDACSENTLGCVALTLDTNDDQCNAVRCDIHTNGANHLSIPTNYGFTSVLPGDILDSRVFHKYVTGLWCLKKHGINYSQGSGDCGNFFKDHDNFLIVVFALLVSYYVFILFFVGLCDSSDDTQGIFHTLFGDRLCSRKTLCPNLRDREIRADMRHTCKFWQYWMWVRDMGFTSVSSILAFFVNVGTDAMFAFSIYDSEKCIAQISLGSSLLSGALFLFVLYCDFHNWRRVYATKDERRKFRLRWGILVLTPVEDIIQTSIVGILIVDGNETLWAWISIFVTIINVFVFRILYLCVTDLFFHTETPQCKNIADFELELGIPGDLSLESEKNSTAGHIAVKSDVLNEVWSEGESASFETPEGCERRAPETANPLLSIVWDRPLSPSQTQDSA